MVICLERGADMHMAQVMPLPLIVSCSSKIQIGFTFLVLAYPGCPGKEAIKWLLLLLLFLKPIFWLSMEKTKPNTTKAHIHQSKENYTHTRLMALFPGLPG